ncbi:MAG: hypothetical protein JSR56_00695 [Proteobacteria bacterium]|nr:hypothetical protein [Pseudomonadota bacterium]
MFAGGGVLPKAACRPALQALGKKQVAELACMVANYCQLVVLLNAYDIPAPGQE